MSDTYRYLIQLLFEDIFSGSRFKESPEISYILAIGKSESSATGDVSGMNDGEGDYLMITLNQFGMLLN